MERLETPGAAAAASNEWSCPICGRTLRRPKPLYGVDVCRKCRNGFANRRQAAWLLDWGLYFGLVLLSNAAADYASSELQPIVKVSWVVAWVAFFFKDGFNGLSPGKWLCGVQVLDSRTYEPIGFWRSVKRNLVTALPYIGVLIPALQMIRGPRWGDRWAQTMVVWRKYAHKPPFDLRGVLCTSCGYDLTGNVSGVCPECGSPIDTTAGDTESAETLSLQAEA